MLLKRHKLIERKDKIMYNVSMNNQLAKISGISLGRHKEQHLLFSLVHLILYYVFGRMR